MASRMIVAIGGNGFTSATSPRLDDFVLARLPGGVRRIGFVATASEGDPVRLKHFRELIAPRVTVASVFDESATAKQAAVWAARLDMIYVGGGDTAMMLSRWRAAGLDRVWADAWRGGIILAGVSAGAVCWFETALVRGALGAMEPIACLGLLGGSVCAHYGTDPDRRGAFGTGIADGSLPAGMGIDDGVAVVFTPDEEPAAWSAEAGSWAYAVSSSGGGAASTALPAFV